MHGTLLRTQPDLFAARAFFCNAPKSALAATLKPGNYTAIGRGKNGSQGIALVEFYKLN